MTTAELLEANHVIRAERDELRRDFAAMADRAAELATQLTLVEKERDVLRAKFTPAILPDIADPRIVKMIQVATDACNADQAAAFGVLLRSVAMFCAVRPGGQVLLAMASDILGSAVEVVRKHPAPGAPS